MNVLYRSCAIPVAWKVVKATEKGSWKPYWIKLLSSLKKIIPTDWNVDVKSDGWLWHKTRLRQPDRAERHWLAMAIAMRLDGYS